MTATASERLFGIGQQAPSTRRLITSADLAAQRVDFAAAVGTLSAFFALADQPAATRDWTSRDAIDNYHRKYPVEAPFIRDWYNAHHDRIDWCIALNGGRDLTAGAGVLPANSGAPRR